MKTFTRFSLILALGIAFTGCDSATSSNPTSVVSATTPAGWTRTDHFVISSTESADFALFGPPVSNYKPTFFAESSPTSGMSPADAATLILQNLESASTVSGVVVDSNSTFNLAGVAGQRFQIHFSYLMNGIYYNLVSRQILLVKSGKDIQLIFHRSADDSSGAAAIRQIEASISIL